VCHELLIYVDLLSLSLCTIKFYNLFAGQLVKRPSNNPKMPEKERQIGL
jgi:hypothetical protein